MIATPQMVKTMPRTASFHIALCLPEGPQRTQRFRAPEVKSWRECRFWRPGRFEGTESVERSGFLGQSQRLASNLADDYGPEGIRTLDLSGSLGRPGGTGGKSRSPCLVKVQARGGCNC